MQPLARLATTGMALTRMRDIFWSTLAHYIQWVDQTLFAMIGNRRTQGSLETRLN